MCLIVKSDTKQYKHGNKKCYIECLLFEKGYRKVTRHHMKDISRSLWDSFEEEDVTRMHRMTEQGGVMEALWLDEMMTPLGVMALSTKRPRLVSPK